MKKEEKEEASNAMFTKFTWIRRKDGVHRGDHCIDFPERDYRVPLIGCSNLQGNDVQVGDIVGVVWKSSILEKRRFDVRCECFSEELLQRGGSIGSFYRTEEHFFQVHRRLTKSKFTVSEVFIHDTKVIRKEINESFSRNHRVDTSLLIPEKLLSSLLEELIVLPDKEVAEPFKIKIKQGKDSWESFSSCRSEAFIEKFHTHLIDVGSSTSSIDEEAMKKALLKKLPYRNYRKTLFELKQEREKEALQSFCSFLENYAEDFIRIFGQEMFYSLGGSSTLSGSSSTIYETIIKHMEQLIQEMLSCLSPRITLTVDNYLYLPCALEPAKICPKNPITSLKLSQIFRVYRTDPRFCMKACSTVTDWCGVLLPPTIRSELQPGDHVRVLITDRVEERKENERIQEERMKLIEQKKKKKESTENEDQEEEIANLPVLQRRSYSDRVIYFQILLHLTESKYLASLENRYLSEYEDIVLVIDSNAVSEIPLSWSENPNFQKYKKMLEDKETEHMGYSITGIGAMEKIDHQFIDFENEIIFRLK